MHLLPGLVFAVAVAISTNQVVCFVLDSSVNGNNSTDCKDKSEECQLLNITINLCADVGRATVLCAKFCDLCPVVGGWSSWGNWSKCDVTCGNGTKTRARWCNNPNPENGGNSCSGVNQEVKHCTFDPCPVRGGWSMWSPWGECSATCDVGIQHRDRSCSNPYPDKYGDHCFGDSRADRICMTHPCTDGGWSAWQQWEACSVTCGGGQKRRHRSCNNPAPSAFGRMCAGTDEQTEICNNVHCQAETVAFHAANVNTSATLAKVFIFRTVHLNEGNGYSDTSGQFKVPEQGLYFFTAHLCSAPNSYLNFGIETLLRNGTSNHYGNTENYENTNRNCGYTSALVRLNVNDHVAVLLTSNSVTNIFTDYYRDSYFTEWHNEVHGIPMDLATVETTVLAEALRRFYCEAAPKVTDSRMKTLTENHAGEYHTNTLKNIRSVINRHLKDLHRPVDIVKDVEFTRANSTLEGFLKSRVSSGASRETKHKEVLQDEDLSQIAKYLSDGYPESPIILRECIWYIIAIHFVSRGLEFHHQLHRDSFEFCKDANGEYVTLNHQVKEKTDQGGIENKKGHPKSEKHHVFATGDALCLVKLLQLFISKTDPSASMLFNQYNKEALEKPLETGIWYTSKPLAKRSFSNFMKDICIGAKLAKTYTPHCLRATAIQAMNDQCSPQDFQKACLK